MNIIAHEDLPKVAHAAAKAKGWWDNPSDVKVLKMLCISEVTEALEAMRIGYRARPEVVDAQMHHFNPAIFKANIKDTVEDELADCAIRLSDWAGYLGKTFTEVEVKPKKWQEHFFNAIKSVIDGYLSEAFAECFAAARALDFDLDKHIALKLEYNKTRQKMHGKKF